MANPKHPPSARPRLPPAPTLAAAYARRRVDVAQLTARAVRPMSGDAVAALQIVEAVLAHFRPLRARLARLPGFDVEKAFAARDYAHALVHAAALVDPARSDGTLVAQIRRAQALRRRLLASARTLAADGRLPRAKIDAIGKRRTVSQGIADCGTLAILFRQKAKAIAGAHPIADADLDEAIALSTSLAGKVHPRGTRRVAKATGARAEAIALRDGFWTLLWNSYEELWRGGAYVWGRVLVEARIPRLGSGGRRRGR